MTNIQINVNKLAKIYTNNNVTICFKMLSASDDPAVLYHVYT